MSKSFLRLSQLEESKAGTLRFNTDGSPVRLTEFEYKKLELRQEDEQQLEIVQHESKLASEFEHYIEEEKKSQQPRI